MLALTYCPFPTVHQPPNAAPSVDYRPDFGNPLGQYMTMYGCLLASGVFCTVSRSVGCSVVVGGSVDVKLLFLLVILWLVSRFVWLRESPTTLLCCAYTYVNA